MILGIVILNTPFMKNKIINGLLILAAIAFFFYGLTQQIAAERAANTNAEMANQLAKCEQLANENKAKAEMALRQAQQLSFELQKAIENGLKNK